MGTAFLGGCGISTPIPMDLTLGKTITASGPASASLTVDSIAVVLPANPSHSYKHCSSLLLESCEPCISKTHLDFTKKSSRGLILILNTSSWNFNLIG